MNWGDFMPGAVGAAMLVAASGLIWAWLRRELLRIERGDYDEPSAGNSRNLPSSPRLNGR